MNGFSTTYGPDTSSTAGKADQGLLAGSKQEEVSGRPVITLRNQFLCNGTVLVVSGVVIFVVGLLIGRVTSSADVTTDTALSNCAPGTTPFGYAGPAAQPPHIAVVAVPSEVTTGQDWIPGSIVEWLQSAGAVVVPVPSGVFWDKSTENWTTNQSSVWTSTRYLAYVYYIDFVVKNEML
eukprot:COSAG01_NODE_7509_length_3176_cov_32.916477_4_plen_179_part_00